MWPVDQVGSNTLAAYVSEVKPTTCPGLQARKPKPKANQSRTTAEAFPENSEATANQKISLLRFHLAIETSFPELLMVECSQPLPVWQCPSHFLLK